MVCFGRHNLRMRTLLKNVGSCWRILCRNGFTVFTMLPTWSAKSWTFDKFNHSITLHYELVQVTSNTNAENNKVQGLHNQVLRWVIYFFLMLWNFEVHVKFTCCTTSAIFVYNNMITCCTYINKCRHRRRTPSDGKSSCESLALLS